MATPVSAERYMTHVYSAARGDEHKEAEFRRILDALGKDGRMTCKAPEIFAALQALRLARPSPAVDMALRPDLRVVIPDFGLAATGFSPPHVPLAASVCQGGFVEAEGLGAYGLAMEQITVTNPYTGSKETVFLDKDGLEKLNSFVSCKSWKWLSAALCPVRTDRVRHVAGDLFLPTTLNQAARVHNIVARFFAVLGALVFDLLTLAFRIMSVVPRAIYNALQPHNGMRAFLLEQGVRADVLDEGIIRIQQPGSDRFYNLIAFP